MNIVALHGFLGTGRDWDAVRAAGPAGAEWICPDLFAPGEDQAVPPPGGPAWLVGYSYGARLALRWLADDPGRWHGALLLSVNPGNFQTESERAARRASDARWADLFRSAAWPDLLAQWQAQKVLAGGPAPERNERDFDRAKLVRGLEEFSVAGQFTDPARLPESLLWLAGGRDERFACLLGRMREAGFPGTFDTVQGAGHRLLHEAPEAVGAGLARLTS